MSSQGDKLLSFCIARDYPGFELDCEATFESGVTAVFGATGSGKTTLLNCIAGLTTPDEGFVELLGDPVYSSTARVNKPPEKRRLGYVFQDAALFPHMSVRDNISYGHNLTPKDSRKADLDQLIDLFVLSDLLDRGVRALSGGERQRVALARALAASPRMLLLDEPMASLDVSFRGAIIRYLKSVWRELRVPMVYVSHSISEVIALAEDVLVLAGGQPVMQGRPSQALVHPRVTAMADYATLENLLDAEVVAPADQDGLVTLKVGDVTLTAPDVSTVAGESLTVSISAGDIILALEVPSGISAQNVVPGRVSEVHTLAARVLVYVDMGVEIVIEITRGALRDLGIREGLQVYLVIKSTSIVPLEGPEQG